MNPELIITAVVSLITAGLLLSERLRPDVVALVVMIVLGLTGVVLPENLFAGFSGSAVITILGISILAQGLNQSGVTRVLGYTMNRLSGKREWRMLLTVMVTGAVLSMGMNNIAAMGIALPAVMSLARRNRISSKRLLIPLAFGITLGGMATLLTTANIIVASSLTDAGLPSLGLLDFIPVGLPVLFIGILFVILMKNKLLPILDDSDKPSMGQLARRLSSLYSLDRFLMEVEVEEDSPLAEQTIQAGQWRRELAVNIVGVKHQSSVVMAPEAAEKIEAGDVILAQGTIGDEQLDEYGLKKVDSPQMSNRLTSSSVAIAEVLLAPHAGLRGKTLHSLNFRKKFGLNVLAVWRNGKVMQEDVTGIPLHGGDTLLVQGPAANIHLLHDEDKYMLLEEDPDAVLNPGKLGLAILITLAALVSGALGWLPVQQSFIAGAVLMILTGCLNIDDIYKAIEWKVVFLIAGMTPLSMAFLSSGLADSIVQGIQQVSAGIPPLGFALIVILIGMLLAQFLGSQVAALIAAPIALSMAQSLGVDPRPLALAAALGCTVAFMTPYSHPINLIAMNSGGYELKDFFKLGLPLTLITVVVILAGLRVFWGL